MASRRSAEVSTWAQGAKDQELAPECWLLGVSVATRYPGGAHLVSLSPYHHTICVQIATPAPPLTASWRHVGRGVCRGGVHVSAVNMSLFLSLSNLRHSMNKMISLSLKIMCFNFMSCRCPAGQSENHEPYLFIRL